MKTHHARLVTPFAVLGIVAEGDYLSAIDFLPPGGAGLHPQTPLAREVCDQLRAYLADPHFSFDLPLQPRGTDFQHRVWQALRKIEVGRTESYGFLAKQLGSAPRPVGQACGANPIPLVIPCHRAVGARTLGGFMHHDGGGPLVIKRWLLEHERAYPRSAG